MLNAPPMRPRFQIELPLPHETALRRLVAPLEAHDERIEGLVAGLHVEWMVPREARHFWSPRLSLEVTPSPEDPRTCRLSGLFGPRPSVWTLFAFGYGGIAFIAATATLFGASQWSIDEAPRALWALPPCGVLALLLYAFSLFGQRLATNELALLRGMLVEVLETSPYSAESPSNHAGPGPSSPAP